MYRIGFIFWKIISVFKRRLSSIETIFIFIIFLSGCIINTSYMQDPKLIEQGKVEITPSIINELIFTKNHYQCGLQLKYGFTEKTNIILKTIYMENPNKNDTSAWFSGDGVDNVFYQSIGILKRTYKDNWNYYLPIGFTINESLIIPSLEPTLLYGKAINKYIDFNPSMKIIIPYSAIFLNMGFGISTNKDKWMLNPEVGVAISFGDKHQGNIIFPTHSGIGFSIKVKY